jgi:hypothetical protein
MKNESAGNVTIYEFTFDGNRGGITGYTCAVLGDPAALTYELDLAPATAPTLVTFDDFTNSPWSSIQSQTASSSVAKHDTFQYLTITYARTYGIYEGAYNTYIGNYYEYIGTNAVILNSHALSEGEYFYGNHDEFTFGNSGGQVWIDGLSTPFGADTITITDAFIAGFDETGTQGQPAGPFSCTVPGSMGASLGNVGIEAHNSSNISLINNSIYENHYEQVLFEDGTSGTIVLSTYSTYCPTCSAQYIESSYQLNNIDFLGTNTATIKFDGIMSEYSSGYGINLAGTGYTVDFRHNGGTGTACLANNTSGRISSGVTPIGLPGTDTCPSH